MNTPLQNDESARIEALRKYALLDTEPEQSYDDLTMLAAYICGAPISLTVLVDTERQWFKSKVGLRATETPRDIAFCSHAIQHSDTFIVEDALADTRFSSNPLVTSDPNIRFYAGAPLITPDGFALGTLCVIDSKPRHLDGKQIEALEALARQTVLLMESRRTMAGLASALEQIKSLQVLLPMCAWCKGIRSDEGYWQGVEEYLSSITGSDVTHGICPACYAKASADLRASRELQE